VTALANMLRELAGLFVDDGALALAIISVVVVAAIVAILITEVPLAAGAILLFGCLAALLVNVARAGRR
jgi:ABC-type multidrug transport system permease subunit